jgi:hypothetical protein
MARLDSRGPSSSSECLPAAPISYQLSDTAISCQKLLYYQQSATIYCYQLPATRNNCTISNQLPYTAISCQLPEITVLSEVSYHILLSAVSYHILTSAVSYQKLPGYQLSATAGIDISCLPLQILISAGRCQLPETIVLLPVRYQILISASRNYITVTRSYQMLISAVRSISCQLPNSCYILYCTVYSMMLFPAIKQI